MIKLFYRHVDIFGDLHTKHANIDKKGQNNIRTAINLVSKQKINLSAVKTNTRYEKTFLTMRKPDSIFGL